MSKTELRHEMLARRRGMSIDEVEVLSDQITTRLMTMIDWTKMQRVHVYESNLDWNEVSTINLRRYIIAKAPQAVVTFGEPSLAAIIPDETYDLIIVPIVAFDTNRQRIGFGGGWYDRFLGKQPDAQKVGLAFEFQCVANIPTEPHDVLLDMVVTEAAVY